MRMIRFFALAICAVTLAFAGQPWHSNALRPNIPRPLVDRFPPGRESQPVSPEEWTQIEAWMKANCPNRLAVYSRISDSDPTKEHAKLLIAERYRIIEHTNYKPLQEALVREAQAQDQIFGAQVRLRDAHHADNAQHQQVKAELKFAVGKLIDAEMDEKGARVVRMQAELEHMKKNRATIIDEWTARMIRRVDAPGRGDAPANFPRTESSSAPDLDPTTNP